MGFWQKVFTCTLWHEGTGRAATEYWDAFCVKAALRVHSPSICQIYISRWFFVFLYFCICICISMSKQLINLQGIHFVTDLQFFSHIIIMCWVFHEKNQSIKVNLFLFALLNWCVRLRLWLPSPTQLQKELLVNLKNTSYKVFLFNLFIFYSLIWIFSPIYTISLWFSTVLFCFRSRGRPWRRMLTGPPKPSCLFKCESINFLINAPGHHIISPPTFRWPDHNFHRSYFSSEFLH